MLAAAAAISAGSGCGRTPTPNDNGGGAGTGAAGGGTGSTTGTGGTPNYSFHFAVDGHGSAYQIGGGSHALAVSTDSSLSVTLTAGIGLPLSGSAYNVGFNCEWFNVKVGSLTVPAFVKKSSYISQPLAAGWMGYDPCQGAQTTWTYDFSAALSPGHATPVSIQIDGAQYDNCRLHTFPGFYGPYYGGCGESAVYPGHSVDGYLQVFTN